MGSDPPQDRGDFEDDRSGERFGRLERQVESLQRAVDDLDERLEKLVDAVIGGRAAVDFSTVTSDRDSQATVADQPSNAGESSAARPSTFVTALGLTGRALLGLAGGYLLRSFSGVEFVPQGVLVLAGLLYAALWLVLATRAARAGKLAASFYGCTSALLGLPLIWEATTSFALLSPSFSAVALGLLTAFALIVSWRSNLAAVAWTYTVGSAAMTAALGGTTHSPLVFAGLQVIIGVAILWLGQARSWSAMPWVAAFAADVEVLLLWAEDAVARGLATATGVLSVQLALFLLYAGSVVFFAYRRDHLKSFGFAQAVIALAVGLGGAARVGHEDFGVELGIFSVALAIAAYTGGLIMLERAKEGAAVLATSLACLTILIGSLLIVPRPALLWSALAIGAVWLGSRRNVYVIALQGSLFAVAGLVASGALATAARAWVFSDVLEHSRLLQWEPLGTVVATTALLWVPMVGTALKKRILRTALLALCGVLLSGYAVIAGSILVPREAGIIDLGLLATLRTAVVAGVAVAVALLGRSSWCREARTLVYPVLFLGGMKVLVEDLSVGRPETLFVGLAIFGAALIVAPRLRSRRE